MLRIKNQQLPTEIQEYLDVLHQKVLGKTAFEEQVAIANHLWDKKADSIEGKNVFATVKVALSQMSTAPGICNYCEQSEAGDIEHIWPKSFFPSRTFRWDNYLFACKQCNTGHKLAHAWIFDPVGSDFAQKLQGSIEPPTDDYCFLDPRAEDPMNFMSLDFRDHMFYAEVVAGNQARTNHKVEKTLDILQLNDREVLRTNRKAAFGNSRRLLQEYLAAMEAQTHAELEAVIDGDPPVDFSQALEVEKQRIMVCTKNELLRQVHFTVFREMQRQVSDLPASIQNLFQKSGALHW